MKNVFIFLGLLFMAGCSDYSNVAEPVNPKQASIDIAISTTVFTEEKYTFKGYKYRDPFIPVEWKNVYNDGNKIRIPALGMLELKGVIRSKNKEDSIALFNGSGVAYFLKNRKLYDNLKREIPGSFGYIDGNTVYVSIDEYGNKLFTLDNNVLLK